MGLVPIDAIMIKHGSFKNVKHWGMWLLSVAGCLVHLIRDMARPLMTMVQVHRLNRDPTASLIALLSQANLLLDKNDLSSLPT
jgi:hypothetical protein